MVFFLIVNLIIMFLIRFTRMYFGLDFLIIFFAISSISFPEFSLNSYYTFRGICVNK